MARRTAIGNAWGWYLGAASPLIVLYFLLPSGGLGQGIVFAFVHLSALVAIVAGVKANRPAFAPAWRLIVAGHVVYAAANLVWYVYPLAFDATLPFPSVADALYIPANAAIVAGIALLMWRRGGRQRASLNDAAIVAIGIGGLSWVFLMKPHVENPSLAASAKLVALAYPVLDLLLLGALMLVAFVPTARNAAYGLLSLGAVPYLLADTAYALTSIEGTFSYGDPYFAGWLLFYVLFGATALHPSMRTLSEPAPEGEPVLTRPRLVFLAVAALTPVVTMALGEALDDGFDGTALSILTAVLFVLVLARVSGLMSDVTEHKRMEKAKDEFISVVSHELRTPLTSIRGALGLLASGAMGQLSEKGQRMLEIASANSDRLVRLINDILDIERIESGQAVLQTQPCDAGDLVTQAADAMRSMAEQAGVRLSVSARPVPLDADPDRILQTLTNLINNAVKFSPPQGTVWVADERRDGQVLFHVRDEGRGIPPEKLETVFGRFQQVDSSDARQKGGSGLGLAICRSIVNQHGGRIWAESRLGGGSTFWFALPARPERRPLEPSPRTDASQAVAVCDDDPEVLEVVAAMLSRHGLEVLPLRGGKELLDAVHAQPPAVILLDLVMPGMTGWDALAALKRDPSTAAIPVVVLSVLGEKEGGVAVGKVADWLVKPVDERALYGAVRRALRPRAPGVRALVVEDDVGLAQVLSEMLERRGVTPLHAQTVQQAVEIGRRMEPDLLVLDLGLPDGDGSDVVRCLREELGLGHLPLIVYTARDLNADERRELQLGRTHFFVKGRTGPAEFEEQMAALLQPIVHSRSGDRAAV